MHVEIARRVTLALSGIDERERAIALRLLDPYAPLDAGRDEDADVVIRGHARPPALVEIHKRAQDGLVTGWDGTKLHVVEDGRACSVSFARDSAEFAYEHGFSFESLFRRWARPALQLAMWRRQGVCVHGSSVVVRGRGVLVAGWSESGKTETALALMERGARFVSDKWTVLGFDRTMGTFPISVGIRRWVVHSLPSLRQSLPKRARAQFLASAAVDALAAGLRRVPSAGVEVPRRLAEQAVLLADRAALSPSELLGAYDDRPAPKEHERLALVVLLTTIPGAAISSRTADPEWAARRLAASGAYERRFYFDLHHRHRYSSDANDFACAHEVEERERAALRSLLQGVRIIEVRAPFPTDPRPIADRVLQELT